MKKFLFIVLMLPLFSFGATYYVSSSQGGSNQGTFANPWDGLSEVEDAAKDGTINPGDSILFKCNDTFLAPDQYNGMQWWGWGGNTGVSGTEANPIVLSKYGTGEPPNFIFPNPASTDSISRVVMSFEGVSWIVIDGLDFKDTRTQSNYKLRAAWTTGAITLGETGDGAEAYNCVVRNCRTNRTGNGIVISGENNTVEDCTLTDFGNVYAIGTGSYGANPITITGKNNYILRNYCSGAWAYSSAFGLNGGAVEMFNTADSNYIMYNRFDDCGGITEYGATAGGRTCRANVVAYNVITNCGNIAYGNFGNDFPVTPNNNQYYNNFYIENSFSRFSGPNFGTGFTTFPTWPTLPEEEEIIFVNAGNPAAATVWNVRNNIFITSNSMNVYQTESSKFVHQNNVYKLSGGSGLGYTIGVSEITTSLQLVLGEGATNPVLWDYHLTTNSPARETGQTIPGLTKDFYGLTLTGVRNIGIDNSTGVAPPQPPSRDNLGSPVFINGIKFKFF